MKEILHAGFDVGSTTVKAVILNENDELLFSRYVRHFSDVRNSVRTLLDEINERYPNEEFTMSAAGSGALDLANGIGVPFTQEQIACSRAIAHWHSDADVSIELGGEDAKLTFYDESGADQKMNETCAGGTGAFLDQMAVLMGTDAAGLNELAKEYKTIYPIASRCGVFAKTDVQALLNDGASRSDVAASIFQAIVNQTIGGLACGRSIKGKVAFLGGPLYFLPMLRVRFAETLKLTEEQVIVPENPHLFVAMGAAISAKDGEAESIAEIERRAKEFFARQDESRLSTLPPLFCDSKECAAFNARHSLDSAKRVPLESYSGNTYLGIDVGSTTVKCVLIGEKGEILFSRYVLGAGKPVAAVRGMIREIYGQLPAGVKIRSSAVTGYGEKLIQSAFGVDFGEVETVAHTVAADYFLPGVNFVIDIGGQDMKCLSVNKGVIDKVFLNEACSSGCGSFLQSFAESLHLDVQSFSELAKQSLAPVDLGSRCTVFMNSRVRQAQKDGAEISDISAGLVYSIVKNALYKVLKIKDSSELGDKIIVQGGTFRNDALLRAFELLVGREVVRPDIPELMGAFGAALIAKGRIGKEQSTLISPEKLENFTAENKTFRCSGCGNACILTRTSFSDGRSFITGNRCSKGAGTQRAKELPPNLVKKKYERLFKHYKPLENAPHGTIGIPRVLNMYDDYPFWFTLFTELGFRVELSSERPDTNLGIDTIPSQTVCYPAKLAHSHICELLERGVKNIFYPILMTERKEFKDANKNYNCPIVIGYPDVVYLNIDGLRAPDVNYMHPEINIEDAKHTAARIAEELARFGITAEQAAKAVEAAEAEQKSFRADMARYGREALDYMTKHDTIGIVLAGHPYHIDPEVNHGIPEMINEYGVTLFTEDSIASMGRMDKNGPSVIDQWVFHSRLYRAAMAIAKDERFKKTELIQIDSFGCGLDAVSSEQTAELLERYGKLYTMVKVDEGSNTGAVRIRVRSLLAAITAGREERAPDKPIAARAEKPMDKNKTLLCPQMSTFQFQFFKTAFAYAGYKLELMPQKGREAAETGLGFVNNDMCYPCAIVVGQFIQALKSGKFDTENTDCLYMQTGGICRASNYVRLLRKALDASGFTKVGIRSFNSQGGDAERLEVPLSVAWRVLLSILYGDLLMRLTLRTRPHEAVKGRTQALYDSWVKRINKNITKGGFRLFKKESKRMVKDFSAVELTGIEKPRVGVVGEILVKYNNEANNNIIDTIEREGGEAFIPDLSTFLLYCLNDPVFRNERLGGGVFPALLGKLGITALEKLRQPIRDAIEGTRFGVLESFDELKVKACRIVSLSNQAGEGWLLTAEMSAMIENGVKNILCIQPFACLPDHITGKGVIKELKRIYKNVNVLPLDYDVSVSSVNQLNRIKLLMATSKV